MDVWDWVRKRVEELYAAGHYRLAEIIESVASLAVNGEHDRVDALVPEGLALARGLRDQWVEVFLRHWHLQSLVLHRSDVKTALPEAVSLLDFSSREQTRDCPQSICVIQDLANCYAQCDGPGYVEERLALASETMEKITPAWGCYVCISAEYADALIDAGRCQQALEYIGDIEKVQVRTGGELDAADFVVQKVRACAALGRYDDALAALGRVQGHRKGSTFDHTLAIHKALVLALAGEHVQAQQVLPAFFTIVTELADFQAWLEVNYRLACHGVIENDWQLGARFETCLARLEHAGIMRDCITVAEQAVDLALRRDSQLTAEYLVRKVEALIPTLHRVLDAEQKLSTMQQRCADARSASPAGPQDIDMQALLQRPPEDPELALELLEAGDRLAAGAFRDDPAWVLLKHENLVKMDRVEAAVQSLRAFVDRQPDSPELLLALGDLLHTRGSSDELLAFLDRMEAQPLGGESLANLLWIRAHYHYKRGESDAARHCLEQVLCKQDTGERQRLSREWLAVLEGEAGNYQRALAHFERLSSMDPDDYNLVWEQCTLAALMQDWKRLQQYALQLGFDSVAARDPVDEQWELCRIVPVSSNGEAVHFEEDHCFAMRTGPVTAKILTVSPIDRPQRYADHVVFHPEPLNVLDHEDEDGNPVDKAGETTVLYRQLGTVTHANYRTFDLDGVYPGQEFIDKLEQALQRLGVVFVRRSTDAYRLYPAQQDKEYPGFYAYLLCPDGLPPTEIDKVLAAHCQALRHPLTWIGLLEAVGDRQGLAVQQAQREAYGIEE